MNLVLAVKAILKILTILLKENQDQELGDLLQQTKYHLNQQEDQWTDTRIQNETRRHEAETNLIIAQTDRERAEAERIQIETQASHTHLFEKRKAEHTATAIVYKSHSGDHHLRVYHGEDAVTIVKQEENHFGDEFPCLEILDIQTTNPMIDLEDLTLLLNEEMEV